MKSRYLSSAGSLAGSATKKVGAARDLGAGTADRSWWWIMLLKKLRSSESRRSEVVEILKIVGKLSWIHTFSATLQNGNVKTRVLQNKLVNVSPRSAVFFFVCTFCAAITTRCLSSRSCTPFATTTGSPSCCLPSPCAASFCLSRGSNIRPRKR